MGAKVRVPEPGNKVVLISKDAFSDAAVKGVDVGDIGVFIGTTPIGTSHMPVVRFGDKDVVTYWKDIRRANRADFSATR